MRKMLILGAAVLLSACAAQPSVPPIVSWSYGAGNGDGVSYPGPAPKFSFAPGVGADVPVSSGMKPTVTYGYGADNETGMMVQMQKPDRAQVAQPAPSTLPAAAAPGVHS